MLMIGVVFFFFKQKTAYEMRISDWSSDVCSSDLEGDLVLFETGAIILHIAEHHAGLLRADANARVRAITWMFAALNTVEPPIVEREAVWYMERNDAWHEHNIPIMDERIRTRLGQLSVWIEMGRTSCRARG